MEGGEQSKDEVVICISDLTSSEPLLMGEEAVRDSSSSYYVPSSIVQGSGEHAGGSGPAGAAREESEGGETHGRSQGDATCSFVTHAFTLAREGRGEGGESLAQRALSECLSSHTPGVRPSDLRLYELRPLKAGPCGGRASEPDDGDVLIGIRVGDGSLSTLGEAVGARAGGQEGPGGQREASLERLEALLREQERLIGEKTAEARRWRDKAEAMAGERQQVASNLTNVHRLLKKSEDQWLEGQTALDRLKGQFSALSSDISKQEDLLFQKYTSPDWKLAEVNQSTRKRLGSKKLASLVQLLESQGGGRPMALVDRLTAEASPPAIEGRHQQFS